jgi:dihydropteroate synthase
LWPILEAIRESFPEVVLSLDTFRSEIARRAVEDFKVDIINDISGGDLDAAMFETVADLQVPYVLMHMKGTPSTMQNNPVYGDVMGEVIGNLAEKTRRLREAGANDIIVDPGFGFGKSLEHNFQLLKNLEQFKLFELPVLVGVSRKSMIYTCMGGDPGSALNGTTVLHTVALTKGANILRVHDVKEAVECVNLVETLNSVL